MFEVNNPPDSYLEFLEQIRETVETTEISFDESYPLALFCVSKNYEGDITYGEDLVDEDSEIEDLQDIIFEIFPNIIRKTGSKYFALVWGGIHELKNGDSREIVTLLSGDLWNTHMLYSKIIRDEENDLCVLDDWEKLEPAEFPEITEPFRKAITYQG